MSDALESSLDGIDGIDTMTTWTRLYSWNCCFFAFAGKFHTYTEHHMNWEGLSSACAKLEPATCKNNEIQEIEMLQNCSLHALYFKGPDPFTHGLGVISITFTFDDEFGTTWDLQSYIHQKTHKSGFMVTCLFTFQKTGDSAGTQQTLLFSIFEAISWLQFPCLLKYS